MGKRSNFRRHKNDDYKTHCIKAVMPLVAHLEPGASFDEPCASAGHLCDHLESLGFRGLTYSDINPQREDIVKMCALNKYKAQRKPDYIITNPPWTRELLHPMIEHFMRLAPTWLLFDAEWSHTEQIKLANKIGCKNTQELMEYCVKVVSVGRIKWFPGTKHTAKDSAAWYLFDANHKGETTFHTRGVW